MDSVEQKRQVSEKFGDYEIDFEMRRLARNGERINLNAKTFDLLSFLITNRGRTITKTELLDAIWPGQFVEEANLSVQVSALRRALDEDRKDPRFLITVPGVGYRFVAESGAYSERIVIERELVREISTEVELNEVLPERVARAAKVEQAGSPASPRPARRPPILVLVGIATLIVASGLLVYRSVGFAPEKPFGSINVTQVTNSGDVLLATIAPDGNTIAYVRSTGEGNSVWIQQIGSANAIEIVPVSIGEFWGLTFSADGKFIYFNRFDGNKTELDLFRVSGLGGKVERIAENVTGAISFSPSGDRIAYIQPDSASNANHLITAKPDGSDQKIAASRSQPATFFFEGRSTSWSPDGRFIACILNSFEANSNYSTILGIDLSDGSEKLIGDTKWHEVTGVEWLADGAHIILAGKKTRTDPSQLWRVTVSGGEADRLTNDLENYSGSSSDAEGNSLVSVKTSAEHGLFVGTRGETVNRQIVFETTEINPIYWADQNTILFRSSRDGSSNIWAISPDGSNRRQLTVAAEADFRGLCRTSDGRYLIYPSWRSGRSNIWRAEADGSDPIPITDGYADSYPVCMADQIVFQRGIFSKPEIWRVSIHGGPAEPISDGRGKWPSLIAGDRISAFRMSGINWLVSELNVAPGTSREVLLPEDLRGSRIEWLSDGRSFYYIGADGSVGNLWSIDVNGRRSQITHFDDQLIADFALSPSEKQIATVRAKTRRDVALIQNRRR